MSRFSKKCHSNLSSIWQKCDLAYYYKQSIDGIEEAKKQAWWMYNNTDTRSTKEKQKVGDLELSYVVVLFSAD